MWSSPCHGRFALALRPAWPIWMPATAPPCLMAEAMAAIPGHSSTPHRPAHPGVMRPSGDTAVASTITSPAPPRASAA
ncbi:hypothetical protein G6F59_018862 [Rhizopus arrhizus]|nr:hypothetical protein G6F59_018862 [Rhizopus arrhizus]